MAWHLRGGGFEILDKVVSLGQVVLTQEVDDEVEAGLRDHVQKTRKLLQGTLTIAEDHLMGLSGEDLRWQVEAVQGEQGKIREKAMV